MGVLLYLTVRKTDDAELVAGAPVALQFVGLCYSDQQLLKDVELLDKALR